MQSLLHFSPMLPPGALFVGGEFVEGRVPQCGEVGVVQAMPQLLRGCFARRGVVGRQQALANCEVRSQRVQRPLPPHWPLVVWHGRRAFLDVSGRDARCGAGGVVDVAHSQRLGEGFVGDMSCKERGGQCRPVPAGQREVGQRQRLGGIGRRRGAAGQSAVEGQELPRLGNPSSRGILPVPPRRAQLVPPLQERNGLGRSLGVPQEQEAQVAVRLSVRGLEFDGPSKRGLGCLQTAGDCQQVAEVVVGVGEFGIEFDGPSKRGLGCLQAVGVCQ